MYHYESLRHFGLAGRATAHVGFDDLAARVEAFLTFGRTSPEELPDQVRRLSSVVLSAVNRPPSDGNPCSSWCCTARLAVASLRSSLAHT
jgi:hypothetical protein